MKRALITGITGQDGSYLAELLLKKGYEVHGTVRRSSLENSEKLAFLKDILPSLSLHTCSIDDHLSLYKVIQKVRPDECYHLAASSFVSYDFDDEASIISLNFISTHFLLSCIKELAPKCRFYYAGSSEMFGTADVTPQTESTSFNPRSIYGISKLSGFHVVRNYRSQHGVFTCTGISYNHESPRRGREFVTRKISMAVAKIHRGQADSLELGNLDARRDWGYAPDYVDAMWRITSLSESPEDFIIATGQTHTIRELLETAFGTVGLDYRKYVKVDQRYFRPSEKIPLCGDASKLTRSLGWKPTKDFATMIREMVQHDLGGNA
jgi:GDPmannose 4,6-dehydratase